MTKFISVEDKPQKEKKGTIFTHFLDEANGWEHTIDTVQTFEKVVYLGKCKYDGDMFACYTNNSIIGIYKGVKGIEFND